MLPTGNHWECSRRSSLLPADCCRLTVWPARCKVAGTASPGSSARQPVTALEFAPWGLLLDGSHMGASGALRLMTRTRPVVGALALLATLSASSRGSGGLGYRTRSTSVEISAEDDDGCHEASALRTKRELTSRSQDLSEGACRFRISGVLLGLPLPWQPSEGGASTPRNSPPISTKYVTGARGTTQH